MKTVAMDQCECCEWGRFFRAAPVPAGTFYLLPLIGKVIVVLPRPQSGKVLKGFYIKAFGKLAVFTPFKVSA